MTRDDLIEAMARVLCASDGTAQCAPICLTRLACSNRNGQCADARRVWGRKATATLSALEAARPDLAAVLRGEAVVVPITTELREHIAIAKMCAPIRCYPGSGGLWFGRNDQIADAEFRDWGAARAFAAIVKAMIAAAEKEMGR